MNLIDDIAKRAEEWNKLLEEGRAKWVECKACGQTHLKVIAK